MWGRRVTLHAKWSKWGMRHSRLGQTRICAHCTALLQCISSIFVTFRKLNGQLLIRLFSNLQIFSCENKEIRWLHWAVIKSVHIYCELSFSAASLKTKPKWIIMKFLDFSDPKKPVAWSFSPHAASQLFWFCPITSTTNQCNLNINGAAL